VNDLGLLAIPLLIFVNALFVAVEYALVSLRQTHVEEMVKNGIRGAKSVEASKANLDRSIAAAQLGITLASIAVGAIGEPAIAYFIQPLFDWLPETWRIVSKHSVATMLALLLITFVHAILGEQVPKMAALRATDRTALLLARPLNIFAAICAPILKVMSAVSRWLLRRMGFRATGKEAAIHTVEELHMIIEDTHEAGLLETDQAVYLQNVFKMTNKTVRECMIPREKMDAIEINTPSQRVLEMVRDWGHTRIPVYEGDLDHIVGILNTKNLFYFLTLGTVVVLDDAIYSATFLDPAESISNALRLFRRSRRPMAVVRDKGGQVLGLITLEDILEEIVGELEDEHDAPAPRAIGRRKGKK
jgi:putative hemolysin